MKNCLNKEDLPDFKVIEIGIEKTYFDAVHVLTTKCREFEIEPVEAAYRWLTFHSFLKPECGDGIIIGASTVNQLEQNINAVKKARTPKRNYRCL